MSQEKKRKQLTYIIGGVLLVGALGYFVYQSSKKEDEIENDNDKTDKIEQPTYGDNDDTIEFNQNDVIDKYEKNENDNNYESKSFEADNDDNVDDMDKPIENDDEVEALDSDIKQEEEPKEQENEQEQEKEKEESPVILTNPVESVKTQESIKMDEQKDEEEIKPEAIPKSKEEIERENKLKESIKKYNKIADKVKKFKSFNYKNGQLTVKVCNATNLDNKDGSGKGEWSDGFVELKLKNNQNKKTSIKKNEENPVWNETFNLNVGDTVRDVLNVTVFDYDHYSSNDYIGEVKINIIDVAANNGSLTKIYDIIGSKTGAKLKLQFTYSETVASK